MVLAAFRAVVLYTFIGFIPGTDETSVPMPITLAVVLSGVEPIVVLTFFIAAIVTLNLTNAIPIKKATNAIATMAALVQVTYLSGIIIPLIALGIPLSPVSIGPGSALFNAPPVFTVDSNIHHILKSWEFVFAILTGSVIAISITYFVTNRLAWEISKFVLRKIPHESIIGLFISLILLLSYMDAGLINVFVVLLIGITCGILNRLGVNYGVQFMTLYAAPWIVEKLISI